MKRTLFIGLAFGACGAWAGLGAEPQPTAAAPELSQTPAAAAYWHRREQLASGTTVHQFVDGRGQVFAVAWSGPFLPDLRALLGRHFDAFEGAAAGPSSTLLVRRDDLVIVSGGRMGAFEGRAWLPRQLPAGFDTGRMP